MRGRSLLLIVLLMGAGLGAPAQGTAALSVQVALNKPPTGQVMLMLCPDSASFDDEEGCRMMKAPADRPVVTLRFTGLLPGTYAIRAVHDLDGNGDIAVNKLGIPTEPFGFSNDAMGKMGPPDFKAAALVVKGGENTATLKMRGGKKEGER